MSVSFSDPDFLKHLHQLADAAEEGSIVAGEEGIAISAGNKKNTVLLIGKASKGPTDEKTTAVAIERYLSANSDKLNQIKEGERAHCKKDLQVLRDKIQLLSPGCSTDKIDALIGKLEPALSPATVETVSTKTVNLDPKATEKHTEPLKSSMDTNLFAHIHADYAVGGKGSVVEGQNSGVTIPYLAKFLQAATPHSEVAQRLEEAGKYAHRISGLGEKLFGRNLDGEYSEGATREFTEGLEQLGRDIITQLTKQGRVTVPGGWTGMPAGHALVYEFRLQEDGKVTATVFNTGDGTGIYHQTFQTEDKFKSLTWVSYEDIPAENVTPLFFRRLLEPKIIPIFNGSLRANAASCYEPIRALGGTEKVEEELDAGDFATPQRAGTCAWRSLMAYLRSELGTHEFKRVAALIKLTALRHYAEHEVVKEQSLSTQNVLIERALEKYSASLVNLKKKGFISQQEFLDMSSEVDAIRREHVARVQKLHALPSSSISRVESSSLAPFEGAMVSPLGSFEVEGSKHLPNSKVETKEDTEARAAAWHLPDVDPNDPAKLLDNLGQLERYLDHCTREGTLPHAEEALRSFLVGLPTPGENSEFWGKIPKEQIPDTIEALHLASARCIGLLSKGTQKNSLSRVLAYQSYAACHLLSLRLDSNHRLRGEKISNLSISELYTDRSLVWDDPSVLKKAHELTQYLRSFRKQQTGEELFSFRRLQEPRKSLVTPEEIGHPLPSTEFVTRCLHSGKTSGTLDIKDFKEAYCANSPPKDSNVPPGFYALRRAAVLVSMCDSGEKRESKMVGLGSHTYDSAPWDSSGGEVKNNVTVPDIDFFLDDEKYRFHIENSRNPTERKKLEVTGHAIDLATVTGPFMAPTLTDRSRDRVKDLGWEDSDEITKLFVNPRDLATTEVFPEGLMPKYKGKNSLSPLTVKQLLLIPRHRALSIRSLLGFLALYDRAEKLPVRQVIEHVLLRPDVLADCSENDPNLFNDLAHWLRHGQEHFTVKGNFEVAAFFVLMEERMRPLFESHGQGETLSDLDKKRTEIDHLIERIQAAEKPDHYLVSRLLSAKLMTWSSAHPPKNVDEALQYMATWSQLTQSRYGSPLTQDFADRSMAQIGNHLAKIFEDPSARKRLLDQRLDSGNISSSSPIHNETLKGDFPYFFSDGPNPITWNAHTDRFILPSGQLASAEPWIFEAAYNQLFGKADVQVFKVNDSVYNLEFQGKSYTVQLGSKESTFEIFTDFHGKRYRYQEALRWDAHLGGVVLRKSPLLDPKKFPHAWECVSEDTAPHFLVANLDREPTFRLDGKKTIVPADSDRYGRYHRGRSREPIEAAHYSIGAVHRIDPQSGALKMTLYNTFSSSADLESRLGLISALQRLEPDQTSLLFWRQPDETDVAKPPAIVKRDEPDSNVPKPVATTKRRKVRSDLRFTKLDDSDDELSRAPGLRAASGTRAGGKDPSAASVWSDSSDDEFGASKPPGLRAASGTRAGANLASGKDPADASVWSDSSDDELGASKPTGLRAASGTRAGANRAGGKRVKRVDPLAASRWSDSSDDEFSDNILSGRGGLLSVNYGYEDLKRRDALLTGGTLERPPITELRVKSEYKKFSKSSAFLRIQLARQNLDFDVKEEQVVDSTGKTQTKLRAYCVQVPGYFVAEKQGGAVFPHEDYLVLENNRGERKLITKVLTSDQPIFAERDPMVPKREKPEYSTRSTVAFDLSPAGDVSSEDSFARIHLAAMYQSIGADVKTWEILQTLYFAKAQFSLEERKLLQEAFLKPQPLGSRTPNDVAIRLKAAAILMENERKYGAAQDMASSNRDARESKQGKDSVQMEVESLYLHYLNTLHSVSPSRLLTDYEELALVDRCPDMPRIFDRKAFLESRKMGYTAPTESYSGSVETYAMSSEETKETIHSLAYGARFLLWPEHEPELDNLKLVWGADVSAHFARLYKLAKTGAPEAISQVRREVSFMRMHNVHNIQRKAQRTNEWLCTVLLAVCDAPGEMPAFPEMPAEARPDFKPKEKSLKDSDDMPPSMLARGRGGRGLANDNTTTWEMEDSSRSEDYEGESPDVDLLSMSVLPSSMMKRLVDGKRGGYEHRIWRQKPTKVPLPEKDLLTAEEIMKRESAAAKAEGRMDPYSPRSFRSEVGVEGGLVKEGLPQYAMGFLVTVDRHLRMRRSAVSKAATDVPVRNVPTAPPRTPDSAPAAFDRTAPTLSDEPTGLEKVIGFDEVFVQKGYFDPPAPLDTKVLNPVRAAEGPLAELNANMNAYVKKSAESPIPRYEWKGDPSASIHKAVSSMEKELPKIKSEEEALKAEVLELFRYVPDPGNDSDLRSDIVSFQFEVQSRRRRQLTMQEALGAFLKGDDESFLRLNPFLNRYSGTAKENTQLDYLRGKLTDYLVIATRRQHLQRALREGRGVQSDIANNKRVDTARISSFANEISRKRAYADPHSRRKYLLFEYASNIRLRPKQATLIDKLLLSAESVEGEEEKDEIVLQMIMGGGKTSVFLAIMANELADGDSLPIVILPETLYPSVRGQLVAQSGNVFAQSIEFFEFDRSSDTSYRALTDRLDRFSDLIARRGYLVMTPQSVQNLEESYQELLDRAVGADATDPIHGQILRLGQILNLLRDKAVGVIDEVDSVLYCRKEHKYALGDKVALHPGRFKVASKIFDILDEPPFDEILGLRQNHQANHKHDKYIKAIEAIPEQLLQALGVEASESEIKEIVAFLKDSGAPPTELMLGLAASKSERDNEIADEIALARELLSRILPVTLSKSGDEKYGFSADPENETGIPYACSNRPLEGSEFSNAYETLCYTIQLYLSHGITEEQTTRWVTMMREHALAEYEHKLRINPNTDAAESKAAKFFAEHFGKVTGKDIYNVTSKDISTIQARVNEQRHLLWAYMKEFVTPQIGVYEEQLTSDGFALVDQLHRVKGFTGTPWTANSIHERLTTVPDVGTDEKTVHLLCNSEAERSTQLLQATPKSDVKGLVQELFAAGAKEEYNALIDVGAWFKGIPNGKAAKEMFAALQEARPEIQELIYYNEENDQKYVLIRGKSEPIPWAEHQSPCPPKQRFSYYDQAHCIGADIKQDRTARALLTVSLNTNCKDVFQGAWRMRGLGDQQRVDLVASPDMMEKVGKAYNKDPDVGTVIALTVENQREVEKQDNLRAFRQRIDNDIRQVCLKAILSSGSSEERVGLWQMFRPLLVRKQVDSPFQQFAVPNEKVDSIESLRRYAQSRMKLVTTILEGVNDSAEGLREKISDLQTQLSEKDSKELSDQLTAVEASLSLLTEHELGEHITSRAVEAKLAMAELLQPFTELKAESVEKPLPAETFSKQQPSEDTNQQVKTKTKAETKAETETETETETAMTVKNAATYKRAAKMTDWIATSEKSIYDPDLLSEDLGYTKMVEPFSTHPEIERDRRHSTSGWSSKTISPGPNAIQPVGGEKLRGFFSAELLQTRNFKESIPVRDISSRGQAQANYVLIQKCGDKVRMALVADDEVPNLTKHLKEDATASDGPRARAAVFSVREGKVIRSGADALSTEDVNQNEQMQYLLTQVKFFNGVCEYTPEEIEHLDKWRQLNPQVTETGTETMSKAYQEQVFRDFMIGRHPELRRGFEISAIKAYFDLED